MPLLKELSPIWLAATLGYRSRRLCLRPASRDEARPYLGFVGRRPSVHQIGGEFRQPTIVGLGPAVFDRNSLGIDTPASLRLRSSAATAWAQGASDPPLRSPTTGAACPALSPGRQAKDVAAIPPRRPTTSRRLIGLPRVAPIDLRRLAMNGSTRQQRDPGVVIGGDGALLHRHSQRETTNVGRQKWVRSTGRRRLVLMSVVPLNSEED